MPTVARGEEIEGMGGEWGVRDGERKKKHTHTPREREREKSVVIS